MFKKISLGLLLAIGLPVFAQETTSSVPPKPLPIRAEVRDIRQNVKNEIKDTRQTLRTEVKETRKAVQGEIKDLRQNVKVEVQNIRDAVRGAEPEKRAEAKKLLEEKREEAKKAIEAKREEFKKTVETKREEIKKKIESQKEELKKRLGTIKDDRKKQLVTKLDEELNKINSKRVERFTENLDKIQKVLGNISNRADKASARGLDITSVKAEIAKAQTAIDASKAAVQTQAAKTYPITITSETALRSNVSAVRQALEKDLKAVQDTVKTAHEATRVAAVALAQIPRVDDDTDESSSPTTSAMPVPASTGTTETEVIPATTETSSQ